MAYRDIYAQSQADPEKFWTEASEAIDWTQPPSRAFFDQ
ncbi:MAG: hypothetical protein L0G27_07740, partial [Paracoccus sp. (in: a-proteobacteria)]|nr:hypothetical protein [Paracoccus sp. (in: a-proteobacteria)]